jgi:hypothetical protein
MSSEEVVTFLPQVLDLLGVEEHEQKYPEKLGRKEEYVKGEGR